MCSKAVSYFFLWEVKSERVENIGLSVQLHGESQIRRVAETEMKDCSSFLTAQYVPVEEDGNALEIFGWCRAAKKDSMVKECGDGFVAT